MARKSRAVVKNVLSSDPVQPAQDGMFGYMNRKIRQTMGDLGFRSEAIGIPLPSFALRWFFGTTCLPLGRIVQINGPEGSCKSSLATDFVRWHMVYGGGGVIAENENKEYVALRHGIWLWNKAFIERHSLAQTRFMEEWQDFFTKTLKMARAYQTSPKGPGRTLPTCWLCDSVMGTSPKSEINAILEKGHASLGYAIAAQLISRYLRATPSLIEDFPFTLVYTNHAQLGMQAPGSFLPPQMVASGGSRLRFMQTMEIECTRVTDLTYPGYGGIRVALLCKKNSFQVSRRKMRADFLWWWADDHEGVNRQYFAWDWHTAAVELLLTFELLEGHAETFKAIKDITGITVTSKSGRKGYSPILGVEKAAACSFRELGRRMESAPPVLDALYDLFHIVKTTPFKPGMDFLKHNSQDDFTSPMAYLYNDVALPNVAGSEDAGIDDFADLPDDGEVQ